MRWLFRALAAVFVAAALFHAAAIVVPTVAEPSPAWRHALFVAINLAVALGLWTRPRGFVWVFAALTAQQLWSHGQHGLEVWRTEGRVDLQSVIAVLGTPLVLALLVRDRRG